MTLNENVNLTLFYNGKILTMDKSNTEADAMCTLNETILAVGDEKNVRDVIKDFIEKLDDELKNQIEIKEVDLSDSCIVPGFIDAHMHPIISIYYKTQLQLSNVKSYSELEEILKNEDKIRKDSEWIVGLDLMENRFTDINEQYFPDRYKLDSLCPNRPVILFRYDGHICAVNSIALKNMGINKSNVKEIPLSSGEIQVDNDGTPTGIFTEGARDYLLEKIPIPSIEIIKETIKRFSDELSSFGITSSGFFVQEGEQGFSGKAGSMELPLLKYLIKKNLIEQDFTIFLDTKKAKKLNRFEKSLSKLVGKSNKINLGGVKGFADGDLGASTAFMYEPFTDSQKGEIGYMVTEKEKIFNLFKECYQLNYHLACHAIGDRANQIIVDIYRDILKGINNENKDSIRCRIEHASVINNETLKDAADLGITIVSQPLFINSEYTWLEKRLGSNRINYCYPFRSIIDSGVILAGASDSPIEPPNVIKAIQICVTRNGFVPEQSITVKEALRMFTYNAAYALGQEKIKGSLEKGKLADLVVLDQIITSVPVDKLADIKILETYHRGKKIYPKELIKN